MAFKGDLPPQRNENVLQTHRLGNLTFEMIHQARSGDCVLINYLNTQSLVGDGKISMSPRELRDLVIEARVQNRESYADIAENDTPLSLKDVVRLFPTILDVKAEQEDIVTVNGKVDQRTLQHNIEHDLLEYLDTYEHHLCTTGMGYHSRSIWKLGEDMYIVIDPTNANGFDQMSKSQLVIFLTNLCHNKKPDNNFFLFLRSKSEEKS